MCTTVHAVGPIHNNRPRRRRLDARNCAHCGANRRGDTSNCNWRMAEVSMQSSVRRGRRALWPIRRVGGFACCRIDLVGEGESKWQATKTPRIIRPQVLGLFSAICVTLSNGEARSAEAMKRSQTDELKPSHRVCSKNSTTT
jgi:hypothetical protein